MLSKNGVGLTTFEKKFPPGQETLSSHGMEFCLEGIIFLQAAVFSAIMSLLNWLLAWE